MHGELPVTRLGSRLHNCRQAKRGHAVFAVVAREILADADLPDGVVNLLSGYGTSVGQALARHPDVDMIRFKGLGAS